MKHLRLATGVKEGERNSGWILRSVDPRSAILEGSNRMVTLDLPEPAADGTSLADGSSAAEDNPAPRILGAPRRRKFMPDNPN